LRAHPLALLREMLAPALPRGMAPLIPAADLRDTADGTPVTVGGLVLVRQRPGTAKGVIFMTLEDETGVANVVVWPDMFERFRRIVLTGRLVAVHGRLQREGIVIHIVAARFRDLSGHLDSLAEDAPPLTVEYGRGDQVTHPSPDQRPGASGDEPPASHDMPRRRSPAPIPGSRHPRDQARILFPSRDFH
jgi:error-prone DNA polymerase